MESATSGRIVLLILDGFGIRKAKKGNAIALARMPFYKSLLEKYPNSTLKAGGESDGLENGTIGNSEVGHLNIGAGRTVYQSSTRVTHAIQTGEFFENNELLEAMQHAKKKKSSLHLVGLLSDAGVHSHIKHLFAIISLAQRHNVQIYIHTITDGRDTAQKAAAKYFTLLEKETKKGKNVRVATICGRFYAMDRDKNWERTEKAYEAIARGNGKRKASAQETISASYKDGKTDEFIEPTIIGEYKGIKRDDLIITFNFRPDRMRQLCSLFEKNKIRLLTLVQYDKALRSRFAYGPLSITNHLGAVLSAHSIKQARIAESEKYAHVTYFFNGLVEKAGLKEERIVVKSRKVETHDRAPEMRAPEITKHVITKMKCRTYGAIIANYANPDMVGHTGKIKETIESLEVIDQSLKKIVENRKDETIIITSDHGNCEEMEGKHKTSHTLNPVPFILISEKKYKLRNGIHADVAPTILELLQIKKPEEMTGESLIEK